MRAQGRDIALSPTGPYAPLDEGEREAAQPSPKIFKNITFEQLSSHARKAGVYSIVQIRGAKMSKCMIDGCDKPQHTQGLCAMHYRRLRRHGDVSATKGVGRPMTPGATAARNDLPESLGSTQRARYAAACNRKLRGELRDGDNAILRGIGVRRREAEAFLVGIFGHIRDVKEGGDV